MLPSLFSNTFSEIYRFFLLSFLQTADEYVQNSMVVKRKNAAILSNVLSLGGASASGPFEDKIQENNINVYSSPSEKVEKKLLPLKSKQSNIDLEKGSEQCQLESSLVVALDTVEQQSERNLRHEAGKPAANLKPGFGTGIGIETGSHCGIQRRGSLLTPLLTPCEVVVEKMPKKIIQRFVGMDTNKDSNVRVRNPSNNRPKPKSRQVLDFVIIFISAIVKKAQGLRSSIRF